MSPTVFGDDQLSVTLTPDDDRLTLTLQDLTHGRQWGPAPLMALDVYDKTVRRCETVDRYHVDAVERVADGVHVRVSSARHALAWGLWLRVGDGELRVRLQMGELYERSPRHFRVYALAVAPGLLQVQDGELLLPVNSGMIARTTGKPPLQDRFLCYMEQERWELVTLLPVCGAGDARGGMSVITTQGDCDAECRVATDGADGGHAGFAFSLRRFWPDPVDAASRELVFTPVAPGRDLAQAVGKRLRRHLLEDRGKRTLRERAAESPAVAYMLDAYIMKLFHGTENEGLMMGNREKGAQTFINVMTFAEARENLSRLHAAGIDKVYTQSVGWNVRGHDGLYPQRFPIEERLGGESGFRELIAHAKSLGYRPGVHDNFLMNVPGAHNWDPEVLIQDLHGEPLVHGWWAGGIEYASWPLALPYERVEGHLRRMRDLGIEGPYYMDYMFQPLEVNYHPRHGGPRADHAAGMTRLCDKAREVFGGAGTELGTLHASLACDLVVTVGATWHVKACHEHWPVKRLLDQWAPVWHYAFSGLTAVECHGVTWDAAMRAVLFGHHPRDEWSARPGVFDPLSDSRIAAQKAIYDLVLGRFGYLQYEELLSWETRAADRQVTRFADGTVVEADFAALTLTVNGEPIARPPALGGTAGF